MYNHMCGLRRTHMITQENLHNPSRSLAEIRDFFHETIRTRTYLFIR